MRIGQVAKVIGEPLSTLKDLRHREILQMASGPWADETEQEILTWGSFSVPSVMVLKGGAQARRTYGLPWPEAIGFVKAALDTVNIHVEGHSPSAKFFDLNVVPDEIWVGRCDFGRADPLMTGDWNCFSGPISELSVNIVKVMGARAAAQALARQRDQHIVLPETKTPQMCLLLNASQLCRETWMQVQEIHNEGSKV